ncbi:MAG: 2-amino-4-hydroxy-6-hydroxymethyldihydropteridine diphosphokinase [Candidatus Acidiferrales bacterium]
MTRLLKSAYLSLGSNLGDRVAHIERALALLEESGVRVRRRSGFYETEPAGMPSQRWFVNSVVEAETELMPLGLLRLLKRIERQLGRSGPSGIAPAARQIDIDILIFGSSRVRLPELVIPHPRLPERRFVLEPLRELAPDWRHPESKLTAAEMLSQLSDHYAVRRLRKV